MTDLVKIRLHGTPEEVEKAAAAIRSVLWVLSESEDYKDRAPSKLVRRYLDVEDIGMLPGPPLNPKTKP